MASDRIQVSTESMVQLANGFVQASNEAQMWKNRLEAKIEELRGGLWLGTGASAFYAEFDGSINTTMDKMVNNLQDIAGMVNSATDVLTEAESQIVQTFKTLFDQLQEIA